MGHVLNAAKQMTKAHNEATVKRYRQSKKIVLFHTKKRQDLEWRVDHSLGRITQASLQAAKERAEQDAEAAVLIYAEDPAAMDAAFARR